MASGVNNTFRQIGIAGGIAALGAVFQTSISHSLKGGLLAAHLSSGQFKSVVAAVSGGESSQIVKATPVAYRQAVATATHQAFITGFNEMIIITSLVALAGALFSFVLIRRKDLAVYAH
jgi:hypothetical protein